MNDYIYDNHTDLISIIVPVYNTYDYLKTCVKSIVNQTYKNIEIILVDDGSEDGSAQLCDEYDGLYQNIHAFHNNHSGATASRNLGIEKSKGNYIGFVDSDDWIETDMYEKLHTAIKYEKANIAVCRFFMNRNGTDYPERRRSLFNGTYRAESGIIVDNLIYSSDYKNKGISPNLWDKIFERSLLVEAQSKVDVRTKFAEDDLCVYSALLNADAVSFIDEPLYHYRQHEESVTKEQDREYFSKITLFYQQMRDVFVKHPKSEVLLEKLDRYMVEFVLRGLNKSFGFGYGNIVPFFMCDKKTLSELTGRRVILYGAGNVGKDYYNQLTNYSAINIVKWIDNNFEECKRNGLDVGPVEVLRTYSDYDFILLAIENERVANLIINTLISEYGIDKEYIRWESPHMFTELLRRV